MAERPKIKDQSQVICNLKDDLKNCRSELVRLAASERMYRELVECTDELIMRVDHQGCLSYINRMASKLIGIDPDRLIGHSVFDLVHSDDRDINREAFGGWIDEKKHRLTFENRIVNQITGQVYCMLWTITIHSPFTYHLLEIILLYRR